MFVNLGSDTKEKIEEKKFDEETKAIINTIIDRCKIENNRLTLQLPLDDYIGRVSFYTGLAKNYVLTLSNPLNAASMPIKLIYRIEIWRQMSLLYCNKTMPTYLSVYKNICDAGFHIIPYPQFFEEMILMGYDYRKTVDGFLLMENPKLSFERFHYLKKIIKMREQGRKIYYVDARVMQLDLTFKKPWLVKQSNDSSTHEPDILFYAVSSFGLESSLYCNEATKNIFVKWVTDILLPNLNSSSVIIMDSCSLYEFSTSASVSKYESKENMLKWLRLHNIPCNDEMHKAELYELIEKSLMKPDLHNVEHLLRVHGHEVLILPHNLDELSLTEQLWSPVKKKFKFFGGTKFKTLVQLKDEIKKYLGALLSAEWKIFENIVITQEKEIFSLHNITETALEHYKMDVVNCDDEVS